MTRRPAPDQHPTARPAPGTQPPRPRRRRHVPREIAAAGVLALTALTLSGCSAIGRPGPATTETRDVTGATAVALATSGRLTIEPGDEVELTVTAGENVIDLLTTEVRDGVLVLDLEDGHWGRLGDVEYHLVVPEVDRLLLSGSGDVRADLPSTRELDVRVSGSGSVEATALQLDALAVVIEGSGSVTLEGAAENQDVQISGSGSFEGEGLRTANAVVLVEGSGGAAVQVTDSLDATVEGSGDIRHTGGAAVTRNISGSGSVVGD